MFSKLAVYAVPCSSEIRLGSPVSGHTGLALILFLFYVRGSSLKELAVAGGGTEKDRRRDLHGQTT